MSRASNALANALEELRLSQTQFAAQCHLQLSQVNRFVRGSYEMGASNIATIARALPEQQRAKVVAAWLRDQLPEAASGLVSVIDNATARTADEQPGNSGDLAAGLQRAIDYLTAEARDHTEISDLLIDLARVLRGDSDR